MRIDHHRLREQFRAAQEGKVSRHAPEDRTSPSLFQYDYLNLSLLAADIAALLESLGPGRGRRVLDLGCDKSPYKAQLEARGFEVRTLDVAPDTGADYVGRAEATGLPDQSFDLVICTQVLEHSDAPWQAVREIRRILRPGGHLLASAPHVWFYHPHPADHWRFTQEGMLRLCEDAGFAAEELRAQGGSAEAAAQVLAFLAYGVLGRWGAPLYALLNLAGLAAGRLVRNELFCLNFAVLARVAR